MSLLGDQFYGHEELPNPLARALFTDARSLSTHQLAIMVEMIRPIIDNCPAALRSHFLPPILSALFQQLDIKASAEWDRSEQRNEGAAEGDNLADEMRDESILRQLTFTSVMLVVGLLDPQKSSKSWILRKPQNANLNSDRSSRLRSCNRRSPHGPLENHA